MSKKVFTILLLAVFMLAQFSIASAATVNGVFTVDALPTFWNDNDDIELNWDVVDMDGLASQHVLVWTRIQDTPANLWTGCWEALNVSGDASNLGNTSLYPNTFFDQDVVEFKFTVDDVAACGAGSEAPATATAADASTFIDGWYIEYFMANPPSLDTDIFERQDVACNTFEMWALASDSLYPQDWWSSEDVGYSGIEAWNEAETGSFAPPAPLGPANELFSWEKTFPSTASGPWTFSIDLIDVGGNDSTTNYFRDGVAPVATVDGPERAACEDFTDTAGHDTETQIRYLADLGLIAGNPDGTYGPDTTLTRAEASVLFEKANGVSDTDAGFGTPPPAGDACEFPDVTAADWFAGWVWQACADGFMNGLADGTFGPADLLTRGQIVTVFNNIYMNGFGVAGTYLDDGTNFDTILNNEWGYWPATYSGIELREAAWTDVAIGAFYAVPVMHAYGVGVADGTSATTFSPDVPVLRGEFAKMLYRALSRVW